MASAVDAELTQYVVIGGANGPHCYEVVPVLNTGDLVVVAASRECPEGQWLEKLPDGSQCGLNLVLVKQSSVLALSQGVSLVNLGKSVLVGELTKAAKKMELQESSTDAEATEKATLMTGVLMMQKSVAGMEAAFKKEGKKMAERMEKLEASNAESSRPIGSKKTKQPEAAAVSRKASTPASMFKDLEKFQGLWKDSGASAGGR